MKRQDLIIVILVVILASAIFSGTMYYWSTVHTPTKADIGVKVVYVYIGNPDVSNLVGSSFNATQPTQGNSLDAYVIIMQVTNLGSQMVSMTEFRAFVAQQITENKIGLNDSQGNPAPGGLGGPSFAISNQIIDDERVGLPTPDFITTWMREVHG
ncbi:MAG: hypothetical protein ABSD92_11910 [Candidatus Bathyarchaeia archaeon]|jgi:hypothetical protein